MKQSKFIDLVLSCLSGTASDEESRMLDKLIAEDFSKKMLFEDLRTNWINEEQDTPAALAAWKKMEPSLAPVPGAESGKRILLHTGNWYATAAAVLFCLGCWWIFSKKPQPAPHAQKITQINAEQTVKDSIWLPDGSLVRLNKGSSIHYEGGLNGKTREVNLKGEGFFQVAKNAEKPFIIHAGKGQIKVLGTAFNVKENDKDTTLTVAVLEGLVSLSSKGRSKSTLLKAGSVGVLSSGLVLVTHTKTANYLSWYNNRLIFDNLSLQEVSKQLEHLYGVNIIIKTKELNSLALTANINHGAITDVISKITYSLDVHYRVRDKGVIELYR